MPTLLALISAGIASFVGYRLLHGYSTVLGVLVSVLLWGAVYYFVKKILADLKA